MSKHKSRDLLHRYEGNPIIELEDVPFKCNTVFNAAATRFKDEYLLLLRVENLQGRSVFVLAHSPDGYDFTVDDFPVIGLPTDVYTPLFVASRVIGWAAHAAEQHFNNRIIRPRSKYTGPALRPYVPIDQRK